VAWAGGVEAVLPGHAGKEALQKLLPGATPSHAPVVPPFPSLSRSWRWLDAGLVPALIDHAAACPAQPHGGRRHSLDQHRPVSHAAALTWVLGRAGGARGAQEAQLALHCIAGRLDVGCARSTVPLLTALLALLDCAAAAGRAPAAEGRPTRDACADVALSRAVVETPMLLEALQAAYARTAWRLPAAEMLVKLRGRPALCGWGGALVPSSSGFGLQEVAAGC
jgi:hypothetical protein